MNMLNPYENSTLLQKIYKRKSANLPLRIAFLDIDLTMTGSQTTTNATRQKLEECGYVVVFVTSRTEEMIMSSQAYRLSKKYGFDRPKPHRGRKNGKYVYIPMESIEASGILDPDVIAGSTGTQILLRQHNGAYIIDNGYNDTMEVDPDSWRSDIMKIISDFNEHGKRAFPELIEDSSNYNNGLADVYPPKYRIVLHFQTNSEKLAFRSLIHNLEKNNHSMNKLNLKIIDDSFPEKENYTLYLSPKHASKKMAVDWIVQQVCTKLAIKPTELQILIAGDSFPDLEMGFNAAQETQATFILVGGSHLSHALTCLNKHSQFGDFFDEIKACLGKVTLKGRYGHQTYKLRNIIIGDEAYKGKLAAESIFALIPQ